MNVNKLMCHWISRTYAQEENQKCYWYFNAGVLKASSRRLIFGGPVIALGLSGKSCPLSSEIYSEANRQFSDSNRDVLMNARSPHKWWSTLKSAVFGLRLLVWVVDWCASRFVKLVCCQPILTASSPESVELPLTCHPSPILITFAFRSSKARRLLL